MKKTAITFEFNCNYLNRMDIRMFFSGGSKANTPPVKPKTDQKNQESKIPHKSSHSSEHRSSKSIDTENNNINAGNNSIYYF